MAGVVHMSVVGDKALIAKFNAALVRTQALKPYFLWDAGEVVRESIREEIVEQGLIRTGDLIRSGRTFYRTKNGISVGYGKGLDYAEPLELGARPHEIKARRVANLVFFWEREGFWFVGPKVNHPGNEPYRYVYQGTMKAMVPLIVIFREYLSQVFKVSFR